MLRRSFDLNPIVINTIVAVFLYWNLGSPISYVVIKGEVHAS